MLNKAHWLLSSVAIITCITLTTPAAEASLCSDQCNATHTTCLLNNEGNCASENLNCQNQCLNNTQSDNNQSQPSNEK